MGQNCIACFKDVNFSNRNIKDIDLAKLHISIGLHTIKEDSLENKADTPIPQDVSNSKPVLFKGNPSTKLSTKALITDKSLPAFFQSPLQSIFYTFNDDSIYQGYLNDTYQKTGKGIEIFKGNKYTGFFLNNKKSIFFAILPKEY